MGFVRKGFDRPFPWCRSQFFTLFRDIREIETVIKKLFFAKYDRMERFF